MIVKGVPISEIIASNPKLIRNTDVIRLLGISQHLEMIRRIHKYPVLQKEININSTTSQSLLDPRTKNTMNLSRKIQSNNQSIHNFKYQPTSTSSSSTFGTKNNSITTSCGPSDDEICCVMGITKSELEESSLMFVWK
mmetsp:Transcript_9181/g.9710  ORF Transcript_9181/g.9710 Transcript_9181/m.9710 type:complete len:138 (-) Transcript_9181:58-471(-)